MRPIIGSPRSSLPRAALGAVTAVGALLAAPLVPALTPTPSHFPGPLCTHAAGGFARLAAQEHHFVVVVGLGGDEERRDRFHTYASRLISAAEGSLNLPPENTVYLGERPDDHPGDVDGRSSREEVESTLARLGASAGPADEVTIVYIGHGSVRDGESRINLPGPDLTAGELGVALRALGDRPVNVIHAGSAAGGFIPALSAPGRVVIAATRLPEQNEPRFPGPLVDALAGEGADTNKDGRVSMLEAFTYARLEVERSYSRGGQLRTEHAALDDNGDGEGSEEPPVDGGDGSLARSRFLAPPASRAPAVADDPALAALYREREEIQGRINALQTRRSEMETEAYQSALEDLLVELALKNREIRALEGGSP
jgi:hypothetical protein